MTSPSALSSGAEAKGGPGGDTPAGRSPRTIADNRNGYALRVRSDGAGSYVSTKQIASLIVGSIR